MGGGVVRTAVIGGAVAACIAGWTGLAWAAGPDAGKAAASTASARGVEFFEKEVRPVLANQCFSCHGPQLQQGGLRLDSREALLKGGKRGPALSGGAFRDSLLLKAVRHEGLQMPPNSKLSEREIQALDTWLAMGAPWGATAPGRTAGRGTWPEIVEAGRRWWSLQPVRKPAMPAVRNRAWSSSPIDLLLLSRMEAKGLKPAPPADRASLARRAYLTLVGIPPSPEETAAFLADTDPRAYERLVDRLLASPHYGERWARHWMDVVRYGETHGYEWNYEIRDPWRYRDYLIRAFNADVPYDQLIREQIAGDLLPQPRWNREERFNESRIGTAIFAFGEAGHDVFREIGLDVLDNQLDTVFKAFQATTLSCARCHDHKLDPFSQKDYYAVFGVLASSRQVVHSLDHPEANAQVQSRLRSLKDEIRREVARGWLTEARAAAQYLPAAQEAVEGRAPAAEGLDPALLQRWQALLKKSRSGLEDPLMAWEAVRKAAPGAAAAAWTAEKERGDKEIRDRAEFNRKNFRVLGDFRGQVDPAWKADGAGLAEGPRRSGAFTVALDGDRAINAVLPAGLYTHLLSDRLNGILLSPDLPKDRPNISLRVVGGKSSFIRTIPDHRQLTDAGRELRQEQPGWIRVSPSSRDERTFLELVTHWHNPRYEGGGNSRRRQQQQRDPDAGSFFGVTQVVASSGGENPRDELPQLARLLAAGAPEDRDGAALRYAGWLEAAVRAWSEDRADDADVATLAWALQNGLLGNAAKSSPALEQAVTAYRTAEKELQPARVVSGLAEAMPIGDAPVYLRGDFRQVGEPAPRRMPEVLRVGRWSTWRAPASTSGRLELAEQIAARNNPLTARVMVNRVWHWLFGAGLVRSTDDFGHMGDPPSHPELLDHLAGSFAAGGWSVKRLIREIMLSQTFRQDSQASPRTAHADPENTLLSHFPARRVEAEVIRDSILAVSGRLDRKLYGPSINPYRFREMPERKLVSGPLDGDGRRSVYTRITLMEGPPFLGAFNLPEAKIAQGRRDVTNVPAQALTLLNDPFVHAQADVWAGKLTGGMDGSVEARLDRMFQAALCRPARPGELLRFAAYVRDLAEQHRVETAGVLQSRTIWKDVAHALFNLKEFIYVR
jgi:cytochrome c553